MGWADLSPTILSASLVWAGPDLDIRVGPEPTWPRKGRGDYFPPSVLLHEEWISFCMQEEMKMKETLEGKEKLLGVEEEVPLLVWLRMPASLTVLRWRPVAEREREREWRWQTIRDANFLAVFGPRFLPFWSMKITSIYRWWKRDTLSLLVPNVDLWFDPKALQPLLQRNNDELPVLCRKMAGRVGYFGAVAPPLQPR